MLINARYSLVKLQDFKYIVDKLFLEKHLIHYLMMSNIFKYRLLSIKTAYLNNQADSKSIKRFILHYFKSPSLKTLTKLPAILPLLDEELSQDDQVKELFIDGKKKLIQQVPSSRKELLNILNALMMCGELMRAVTLFEQYGYLLKGKSHDTVQLEINAQLNLKQELVKALQNAWDSTFSPRNTQKKQIILLLPPTFHRADLHNVDGNLVSRLIVAFYSNFYKELHKRLGSQLRVEYEFNWRKTKESISEGKNIISYHTNFSNHLFNVKESALSGYFTIDKQGYSGWHSCANSDFFVQRQNYIKEQVDGVFKKMVDEIISQKQSKYAQTDKSFDTPDGFVFLPLQVEDDSVASLAAIDTFSLLRMLVMLVQELKFMLVIKRHPMCRSYRIKNFLSQLQSTPNVIITDASIHRIIPKAKLVVTVNSGVGMESLLYEKTVITTGKSEYQQATLQAKTFSEIRNFIQSDARVDTGLIRDFVYYFYTDHLYRYDDIEKLESFVCTHFA